MAAAAAAAAAGGGDGAHLTEYERQRLAHIRRNQEYMARLGLKTAAARLGAGGGGGAPSAEERKRERAEAAERRRKRKAERAALGPERRSSRLRGAKPDYTGAAVDALSDSDGSDGADAGVSFSPRRTEEDMLAETQRWLERSRAALLALGGEAAGGGCEWRAEAVRRWGKEVARAARDDDGFDWEAYVRSRMSRPPPPSPQGLLQEFYAFDQWQLLIACVLMSRVSSWNTKHSAIAAFFERWPTPSDAIVASSADLFEVMAPLGLFENRVKSVVAVTERFLGAGVFEVRVHSTTTYFFFFFELMGWLGWLVGWGAREGHSALRAARVCDELMGWWVGWVGWGPRGAFGAASGALVRRVDGLVGWLGWLGGERSIRRCERRARATS